MARRLAAVTRLSRAEAWLLFQSALLLPIVATSLRVAGFQRSYRWLYRPVGSESNDDIIMVSRSVERAAQNIPGFSPTCLPRSLVLWHLLRRRGAPAQLQIGVAKRKGQFAAHAWVENEGRVINDRPDIAQFYSRLDMHHLPPKGY